MSCPDMDTRFRRLSEETGETEAATLEYVLDHVEECESCHQRLEGIVGRNQVLEWTRMRSARLVPDETLPETIGSYRILHELGRGGMGVVVLAEQERPKRRVALKIMSPGILSEDMRRRFELEVEILGRLEHPSIARIIDSGTASVCGEIRPFFAMEYVAGTRLDEYLSHHDLSVKERLGLFLQVCEAVHHAHLKGVIHRDLKPANILIDASGRPRVIDFGVALAVDADGLAATHLTATGCVIGTLAYMAPEQAIGDKDATDTRTDVYGLGAVLYEILCRRPPLDMSASPPAVALQRIAEDEVPAPSSIVSRIARPLDWIVFKALAKDREQRYASARDLAADIRNFLSSKPLEAGPTGQLYRMWLFARRNRTLVSAAIVVLVALVIGVIGLGYGIVESRLATQEARRTARLAERRATEARLAKEEAVRSADEALRAKAAYESAYDFVARAFDPQSPTGVTGQPRTMRQVLDANLPAIDTTFVDSAASRADLYDLFGQWYEILGLYDVAERCLERTVAIRAELTGPDSADALEAVHRLGLIYIRQARFDDAAEALRRAARGFERLGGADDLSAISAGSDLAQALMQTGRLDEAERLLSEAYEAVRDRWGEDDPNTIDALQNLGVFYHAQGRSQEALEALERALELNRQHFADENFQTFDLMRNLAAICVGMGKTARAEPLYRDSFRGHERLFGAEHPLVAQRAYDLGVLCALMGYTVEGLGLLQRAFDIHHHRNAGDHPDMIRVSLDLGVLLARMGRPSEAEEKLEGALAASRRTHGEDHEITALIAEQLEDVEPEARLRRRLEEWRKLVGFGHSSTLEAFDALLDYYESAGRVDRFGPVLQQALAAEGLEAELRLAYSSRVARYLKARGELAGAAQAMKEVAEMSRAMLGPDHLHAIRYAADAQALQADLDAQEAPESTDGESS